MQPEILPFFSEEYRDLKQCWHAGCLQSKRGDKISPRVLFFFGNLLHTHTPLPGHIILLCGSCSGAKGKKLRDDDPFIAFSWGNCPAAWQDVWWGQEVCSERERQHTLGYRKERKNGVGTG